MQSGGIYRVEYSKLITNSEMLTHNYEKYFGPNGGKLIFVEDAPEEDLEYKLIFLNGQGERVALYPVHFTEGWVKLIGPL